jgi:hypothetical protein
VCYRFWKNGKQVDPFKEDLPASKPLDERLKPIYDSIRKPLRLQLDNIPFMSEAEMEFAQQQTEEKQQ